MILVKSFEDEGTTGRLGKVVRGGDTDRSGTYDDVVKILRTVSHGPSAFALKSIFVGLRAGHRIVGTPDQRMIFSS